MDVTLNQFLIIKNESSRPMIGGELFG